jgi:hypothetical protein
MVEDVTSRLRNTVGCEYGYPNWLSPELNEWILEAVAEIEKLRRLRRAALDKLDTLAAENEQLRASRNLQGQLSDSLGQFISQLR